MRIALDGCDGVGKTTVAEKLANEFGCNIIRLTYKGDRSVAAYASMMNVENVVHDRTFISEVVYPKYFRRASRLSAASIPALFELIDQNDMKVFILTGSDETIRERIGKRGDEFIHNMDDFIEINRDYLNIAKMHGYTIIDTTNKSIEEVVKEIGGYLK